MAGKKPSNDNSKVKVLYQNLNGVWYAFANVGDNLFFGKVPLQARAKSEGAKATPPKARKLARSA
jgi:hypothetical protein